MKITKWNPDHPEIVEGEFTKEERVFIEKIFGKIKPGTQLHVSVDLKGICIGCGCTDADCSQCIKKTGKRCYWVSPNKCSACFDEHGDLIKQ